MTLRQVSGLVAAAAVCFLTAGCAPVGEKPSVLAAPTSTRPVSPPPRSAPKGPLGWVDNYDAVCISLVRNVPPKTAVKEIANGRLIPLRSENAANDYAYGNGSGGGGGGYRVWIAAGRVGRWTFVWEDNGFGGTLPRIINRLSRGTAFVSSYWDVNDDEQFTYEVNSKIVREFDPVLDKRSGGIGRPLAAEFRQRWFAQPEKSMLRLATSITKVPLANPSWLKEAGVTFWGAQGR